MRSPNTTQTTGRYTVLSPLSKILVSILACSLLAACATSPTGRSQLMLISPDAAIVQSKQAYLSTVNELGRQTAR
jgi:outer membrane biogenesis lipoprotein LolB